MAELAKPLPECLYASRNRDRRRARSAQEADSWDFDRLLRCGWCANRKQHSANRKKDSSMQGLPFYCQSAAAVDYLITRSARVSKIGGMVTPICFAVFKLITISNLVGCSTGKSAGLAPLRILSTYV